MVTVTQVGYAVGLALLLPLGDLLENRGLSSRTLLVTAAALAVAAAPPGFGVFLVALALVGVTSVVAQVLIPLAAHLAPEQSRGKWVGAVAGPVSQHWGWPGVAVFAAILVAGAGLVWAAERFLSR